MSTVPEPEVAMPENMMGQIFTYNVGTSTTTCTALLALCNAANGLLSPKPPTFEALFCSTYVHYFAELLLYCSTDMRSQFVDGVSNSSGGW